ncbi:hypothetical protein CBR_g27790 [Chara braunii]|uniref:PHD-type domain-containing protein n=1 Tax=Chara braunii TaxID=69332 RepID=A0A388L8D7_CHABU|nr:hypothetical protein CBR_g27790 [Chara braunii]|eukprot:GBG78566.1 hypothetical protein CBR_g27790 [Chara braunii]
MNIIRAALKFSLIHYVCMCMKVEEAVRKLEEEIGPLSGPVVGGLREHVWRRPRAAEVQVMIGHILDQAEILMDTFDELPDGLCIQGSDEAKLSGAECFVCSEKGAVVTCSGKQCGRVYHLQCAGLWVVPPAGMWLCPSCGAKAAALSTPGSQDDWFSLLDSSNFTAGGLKYNNNFAAGDREKIQTTSSSSVRTLAAPIVVYFSEIRSTSVRVHWKMPEGEGAGFCDQGIIKGFKVWHKKVANNAHDDKFGAPPCVPASFSSLSVLGLDSDTQYAFKVAGVTADGDGQASAIAICQTLPTESGQSKLAHSSGKSWCPALNPPGPAVPSSRLHNMAPDSTVTSDEHGEKVIDGPRPHDQVIHVEMPHPNTVQSVTDSGADGRGPAFDTCQRDRDMGWTRGGEMMILQPCRMMAQEKQFDVPEAVRGEGSGSAGYGGMATGSQETSLEEGVCGGGGTYQEQLPVNTVVGPGRVMLNEGDREIVNCLRHVCLLEKSGHLSKDFRLKFLTWFSRRASDAEKKVVAMILCALGDEPATLAEQLVDTFSELIGTLPGGKTELMEAMHMEGFVNGLREASAVERASTAAGALTSPVTGAGGIISDVPPAAVPLLVPAGGEDGLEGLRAPGSDLLEAPFINWKVD